MPLYYGPIWRLLYRARGLFGSELIFIGEWIVNSASSTMYYMAERNSRRSVPSSIFFCSSLYSWFYRKSFEFSSTILEISRRNCIVTSEFRRGFPKILQNSMQDDVLKGLSLLQIHQINLFQSFFHSFFHLCFHIIL